MSIIGNPILLMQSGKYYIFRSGYGNASDWTTFTQVRRTASVGTDSINIAQASAGTNNTWSAIQCKTPLDSVLPNYNTLYVEFQFSLIGTGGTNMTKAFGIARSLPTSQTDYSWYGYKTFVGSSTNTRVTLSLDVSNLSTGYFAFEGPMLGDVFNVWLE